MKQFMTVLKFEMDNYFKNKSFMITTGILMLILCGVIIIPTLIPGLLGDDGKKEALHNHTSYEEKSEDDTSEKDMLGVFVTKDIKEQAESFLQTMPVEWKFYESEEELKDAIKEDKLEAGFILDSMDKFTYVVNNSSLYDSWSEMFEQSLRKWQKDQYLISQGLTKDQIMQSDVIAIEKNEVVLGKDGVNSYWYTYALVFAIYFLIIFYGQMIAVSVTNEKSNRAIEILVTSVNPNSLIFGKVLAGALAGILQMALILGSGFLSYSIVQNQWGGKLNFLFDIPTEVWIAYVCFGIFSYLLYALLFGALGALVSKTEDISKSATPLMLVYIASFFISIFGMQSFSDSIVMKIASFIPFTSGNAMFVRICMGNVSTWEVVISFLLLAGSCVLTGRFAAKLFRYGTLHYGNPIKLRKAWKNIKIQK